MINHVSMTGVIKSINKDLGTISFEYTRSYKCQDGYYKKDLFTLRNWTKDNSNHLIQLKEGILIAIDGRIEVENNKVFIIVENYSRMSI